MERKIFMAILVIAVAMVMVSSAAYSQEVAVSEASQRIGMSDLLNSVVPPLSPLLQQNGSSIDVSNREAVFNVTDGENLKVRYMNMFLNAVAHAPKSVKITLGYDSGNRTLFIVVPNKDIRFDVDKDIKDMNGNEYHLKTTVGKEAIYSMII